MKLTPLLTKIAASLFIAAKAVKGQQCDGMPDSIANLPAFLSTIKQTWCELKLNDPSGGEAALLTSMVGAALVADPSYAFFGTCFQDVVDGMKFTQEQRIQGIKDYTQLQCDDTKTKVATLSVLTETDSPYEPLRERFEPWNLYICKSATCDTDTLNQFLALICLDFYAVGGIPFNEGVIVSETVTPIAECWMKQIGYPMNNPDVYCSGERVCSNTKLIEVKLGTDAPFEIAICDDNDCLASLGDVPPKYLEGWLNEVERSKTKQNRYCLPKEKYRQELLSVDITFSEKEFNLTDYCSAAAASGRIGRCVASETTNTPTQAPTVKVVASETESAPAESAAWMTMESFVLKCFVGLLPLLLL